MLFKRRAVFAAFLFCVGWGASSSASTVDILLSNSLQTISIVNDATSVNTVESVTYSLGPAAAGRATFDLAQGGIASDFLVDPNFPDEPSDFFQTVTFDVGLAPGESVQFAGIDIDLVIGLNPLQVISSTAIQQFVDPGLSLTDAFISVLWSNGSTSLANLTNQIWSLDQSFSLQGAVATTPIPASVSTLGGALALMVYLAWRRQRYA